MDNYITILLSKTGKKHSGKYEAIVSIEDAILAEFNWTSLRGEYAYRLVRVSNKKYHIRLHRVIMSRMLERELLPTEHVDHIDGNGLNNMRSNLRLATRTENVRNSKRPVTNTSGYKGVSWHKARNKWRATIQVNNKHIHLGLFDTPEEAYAAYCEAAIKYHGEFANFG